MPILITLQFTRWARPHFREREILHGQLNRRTGM
uniref:Uncharacterized protein n=1 Tax=Anguilla anguilla TaxID=7936 RepID=A0A0E9W5B0_ANGAN